MELRQLRHFVIVAEELHFSRAAERLEMTQPPLSQSIQRLESELGVRLFERTHRSVELTPVGAALLPHAQKVLTGANELPELAQQLFRGDEGRLRLAFVSTADYGVLPELLRRFGAEYPRVKIDLLEATSDRQIDGLVSESIDAGIVIGTGEGPLPESIQYLPLNRERLMAVTPITSFEGRESVAISELSGQPLIIFPRRVAPSLHDAITGCFTARGLDPHFGQEAIQMQTIVSLVSAGLGIAIVPDSLRNLQRTGVRHLHLDGAQTEIETGLIWRRSNGSPTLRNLIRIARAR